ncbi:hypothetical protein ANCDUO_10211 [Ancylostoma duodenale]|uniref:Uncharacterized protein n=1 Tax=Ancylostoma duodenale TaxID=51022 RepID=A0A0C2GEE4_9BILA|nr:hypothetical protein ANCDUO_10211 [Ancylostoma duodenale]
MATKRTNRGLRRPKWRRTKACNTYKAKPQRMSSPPQCHNVVGVPFTRRRDILQRAAELNERIKKAYTCSHNNN